MKIGEDLTGQKFGRLTVTGRSQIKANSKTLWECSCDCGGTSRVRSVKLRGGYTKSCGCLILRPNKREPDGSFSKTHGQHDTALYGIWAKAKGRCCNPTDDAYPKYGGRGITMCERWMNSFEAFAEDMGPRPSRRQIDRRDNNRGYEPGNCRWATSIQQQNNRRSNHRIAINGEIHTFAEWGRIAGIDQCMVRSRWMAGKTGMQILAPATRVPWNKNSPAAIVEGSNV